MRNCRSQRPTEKPVFRLIIEPKESSRWQVTADAEYPLSQRVMVAVNDGVKTAFNTQAVDEAFYWIQLRIRSLEQQSDSIGTAIELVKSDTKREIQQLVEHTHRSVISVVIGRPWCL